MASCYGTRWLYTAGENKFGAPKMQNNFRALSTSLNNFISFLLLKDILKSNLKPIVIASRVISKETNNDRNKRSPILLSQY